ncbi:SGNH/GDSL hydrolase family protein [Mycobacterium sp. LTG2003]
MTTGSLRGRWLAGLLIVIGVVALAGGVAWASAGNRVETSPPARVSLEPPPPPERPALAVLGDSFSSGAGADWQTGWVQLVADSMCWTVLPASRPRGIGAQGGTGYTTAAAEIGKLRYGDRVDAVMAGNPQIILVQGGINDRAARSEVITEAAAATFRAVKAKSGDAEFIAIGPVAPPDPTIPPEEAARVSGAIAAAAHNVGVPYIDPVAERWLVNPAMWSPDHTNPNREGYREYAQRLVDKFVQAGVKPSCG